MSETFRCDDKETLVAYLYGEIEAGTRREVERHLRGCAACTQEIDGLRAVRQDLELWQPPEAELGFAVVQKPAATVLRPSRWSRLSPPVWAQAAAAVLVLAAGAAIANVQIAYNASGLTVSTGWMTPRAAEPMPGVNSSAPGLDAAGAPAPVALAPPAEDWRPALIALETALRDEMAAIKRASTADVRNAQALSPDGAALLRRVEAMIRDSERRSRQELALRITQVNRDVEGRRSAEMVRMQQDLWRTVANQQEMMSMIRRASVQNP
jgi:hypothetical protein